MNKTIRVSLCDNSPASLFGLKQILSQDPSIDTVTECVSIEEVCHKLMSEDPDILVLDIGDNREYSLNYLKQIRQLCPDVKIIVFTTCSDGKMIMDTMELGVQGFQLKNASPEELISSVHAVYNGGTSVSATVGSAVVEHLCSEQNQVQKILSNREQEVLDLLARGKSNKDIAEKLMITPRTVKYHVSSIFSKLKVKNRTEAAAKWVH